MSKYLLKYINLHIIQIILGFVQIIFSSLNIQILIFPENFIPKDFLCHKASLIQIAFYIRFYLSVCLK